MPRRATPPTSSPGSADVLATQARRAGRRAGVIARDRSRRARARPVRLRARGRSRRSRRGRLPGAPSKRSERRPFRNRSRQPEPEPEALSPLARAAAFKPLFADTDEEIEVAFEQGLERTRGGFMTRLRACPRRPDRTDPSWDDVEETLIAGDVGAALAMDIVERRPPPARPGGRGGRGPGGARGHARPA